MRLKDRILLKIDSSEKDFFFRKEFVGMASDTQINRVLKQLIAENKLAKISSGVYAKVVRSPLSGNLVLSRSLPDLAHRILKDLGYETGMSSLRRANLEGKTTQVSTGRVIGILSGRLPTRKIKHKGVSIYYEAIRR
jgi:hypothetical protein